MNTTTLITTPIVLAIAIWTARALTWARAPRIVVGLVGLVVIWLVHREIARVNRMTEAVRVNRARIAELREREAEQIAEIERQDAQLAELREREALTRLAVTNPRPWNTH